MVVNKLKFGAFMVLAIVGVYLITYFVNQAVPSVPVVDFGIPLLAISILLVGFIAFRYGVANRKLDKKDFITLGIFMLIIAGAVLYLPEWLPEWFSGNISLSKIIAETNLMKSAIGLP